MQSDQDGNMISKNEGSMHSLTNESLFVLDCYLSCYFGGDQSHSPNKGTKVQVSLPNFSTHLFVDMYCMGVCNSKSYYFFIDYGTYYITYWSNVKKLQI